MNRTSQPRAAVVGVADHWGWAVLVTVASDGVVIDRRRVVLVDDALPKYPHHHEAQTLPLPEAAELIGRVRLSAEHHARLCLDALSDSVLRTIGGIAIRECPSLPETVEERLSDYRAQNVADSVIYREALAAAATERGWRVYWYDARSVFAEAASAMSRTSIDDLLAATGAALGPPWRKDHRMAMAAAIAATGRAG